MRKASAPKTSTVMRTGPRRTNGRLETVAIDWESIGHGTVGAEIATLVFGTMRRGTFPARRAADLDRVVFAGYLQGLHGAGWQGDGDVVRLGYTAAVALRWSLLMRTLQVLTDDGARSRLAHLLQVSEERGVQHVTLLSMFLLQCADEARMLSRRFISARDCWASGAQLSELRRLCFRYIAEISAFATLRPTRSSTPAATSTSKLFSSPTWLWPAPRRSFPLLTTTDPDTARDFGRGPCL
jgi:hypothetical protein